MAFDHDRLDVYRLAIEFIAWAGELLDMSLKKSAHRLNALAHDRGLSAATEYEDEQEALTEDRAR
jgi:hypothetical protein